MAVGTNRHYTVQTINGRHFLQTADLCGFPKKLAREVIDEIGDTAKAKIDEAISGLAPDFPAFVEGSISNAAIKRINSLANIPATPNRKCRTKVLTLRLKTKNEKAASDLNEGSWPMTKISVMKFRLRCRLTKMENTTHQELSDKIWSVANKRGPYRPPQYRRVMLPLIVLRRLDCVLEPTKDKVLDQFKT